MERLKLSCGIVILWGLYDPGYAFVFSCRFPRVSSNMLLMILYNGLSESAITGCSIRCYRSVKELVLDFHQPLQ